MRSRPDPLSTENNTLTAEKTRLEGLISDFKGGKPDLAPRLALIQAEKKQQEIYLKNLTLDLTELQRKNKELQTKKTDLESKPKSVDIQNLENLNADFVTAKDRFDLLAAEIQSLKDQIGHGESKAERMQRLEEEHKQNIKKLGDLDDAGNDLEKELLKVGGSLAKSEKLEVDLESRKTLLTEQLETLQEQCLAIEREKKKLLDQAAQSKKLPATSGVSSSGGEIPKSGPPPKPQTPILPVNVKSDSEGESSSSIEEERNETLTQGSVWGL